MRNLMFIQPNSNVVFTEVTQYIVIQYSFYSHPTTIIILHLIIFSVPILKDQFQNLNDKFSF